MSKSKHSDAQIIAGLKQVEACRTVADVARECGGPSAHDLRTEGEVRRHGSQGRAKQPVEAVGGDLSLDGEMLKLVDRSGLPNALQQMDCQSSAASSSLHECIGG